MDKVLLVIAPQVFRDEELFETREELEKAGFETVIASTAKGICTGKIYGLAIVGSFKGFDVISEV